MNTKTETEKSSSIRKVMRIEPLSRKLEEARNEGSTQAFAELNHKAKLSDKRLYSQACAENSFSK